MAPKPVLTATKLQGPSACVMSILPDGWWLEEGRNGVPMTQHYPLESGAGPGRPQALMEGTGDRGSVGRHGARTVMRELPGEPGDTHTGLGTELSSSSRRLSTLGRTSSRPRAPFRLGFSFIRGPALPASRLLLSGVP